MMFKEGESPVTELKLASTLLLLRRCCDGFFWWHELLGWGTGGSGWPGGPRFESMSCLGRGGAFEGRLGWLCDRFLRGVRRGPGLCCAEEEDTESHSEEDEEDAYVETSSQDDEKQVSGRRRTDPESLRANCGLRVPRPTLETRLGPEDAREKPLLLEGMDSMGDKGVGRNCDKPGV